MRSSAILQLACGLAFALAAIAAADDKAVRVERRAEFLKQMRALAEASDVRSRIRISPPSWSRPRLPLRRSAAAIPRRHDVDLDRWCPASGLPEDRSQAALGHRQAALGLLLHVALPDPSERRAGPRTARGKRPKRASSSSQCCRGRPGSTHRRKAPGSPRDRPRLYRPDPSSIRAPTNRPKCGCSPRRSIEYADPETKVLLGAVFGFEVNGTNPDLLVLIEVRGDGDKPAWHFAPARMTRAASR